MYRIIKKLHDKITTDYTLLLGLCKKHGQIWIWHYLSCLIGGEWKFLFVDKQTSLYLSYIYAWPSTWVLKPWVATQNWVAAYFGVGQRNDNGSHGSPTVEKLSKVV